MFRANQLLPAVVVPLLAVVALFGYLAGAHRSSDSTRSIWVANHSQATRVASAATVLFEYPTSWQRAARLPALPGLALEHPFLLSPGGNPAHAGLLSGQLAGGEPGPLPPGLLALVDRVPPTEVVSLTNAQAYRYRGLHIRGFNPTVDLYLAPSVGANTTLVACYAASGYLHYLHQCEEIVAQLTLVGQAAAVLSPNTAYAAALGGVLARLDSARAKLRAELHERTQPAGIASLATALAARFADASSALQALDPPLVAGEAQTALAAAMAETRDSYAALSSAAREEAPSEYRAAERRVASGESAINDALGSFALLGYGRA
jgi:hypothetical protein